MADFKQIVWVASFPKSGNTWVRLFLDAYFLNDLDINDIVCSVADDRSGLYAMGDGSKAEKLPIQLQHLARPMAMLRLVKQYNEANHGIPLFVKTHTAHMVANGIEMLSEPLTKATIFIVRDPRDVVQSFAKHMGCDIDQAIEWMDDKYRTLSPREGAMADFTSSWGGSTLSYLNADTHNVKLFRYEDMRADPFKAFSEMLKHAGVEPDPFRVKRALDMVELDRLREIEAKNGFKESSPNAKNSFFGKGKVGGWKGKLTSSQAYKIEKKFRRVMKRLGYLQDKAACH